MRFGEFRLFSSGDDKFAVHPDAAVAVRRSFVGAEISLANGQSFLVNEDPRYVAQQLWGFLNETDNGFFNAQHVLAIKALHSGCSLLLTGGSTLDVAMGVEQMVTFLRGLEQHRKSMLDVAERTGL